VANDLVIDAPAPVGNVADIAENNVWLTDVAAVENVGNQANNNDNQAVGNDGNTFMLPTMTSVEPTITYFNVQLRLFNKQLRLKDGKINDLEAKIDCLETRLTELYDKVGGPADWPGCTSVDINFSYDMSDMIEMEKEEEEKEKKKEELEEGCNGGNHKQQPYKRRRGLKEGEDEWTSRGKVKGEDVLRILINERHHIIEIFPLPEEAT
jgi:hypothetical protein